MKSFGLWHLAAPVSVEVSERILRDIKKPSSVHKNRALIFNYVTVAANCFQYCILHCFVCIRFHPSS